MLHITLLDVIRVYDINVTYYQQEWTKSEFYDENRM